MAFSRRQEMTEMAVKMRACRVCGDRFTYPEHKSRATRSRCEKCVDIPDQVQRVFESMRRKIDRLSKEVAELKRADETN